MLGSQEIENQLFIQLLRWSLGIKGMRVENPALGIFEKEIVIRDAF